MADVNAQPGEVVAGSGALGASADSDAYPGGRDDQDTAVFMDDDVVGGALKELGHDPGKPGTQPAGGDGAQPEPPTAAEPGAGEEPPAVGRKPEDAAAGEGPDTGGTEPPVEGAEPQAAADAQPPDGNQKPGTDDGTKKPDGLTEQQQAAVDKRIDKEVGRRKHAEEQLEAATERIQELRKTSAEMERHLAEGTKAGAAHMGLNPLFLAETEDEIDQRAQNISVFRKFARTYPEGYPGGEDQQKDPPVSKELIAQKLDQLEDEQLLLPKARRNVRERQEYVELARVAFPAMFEEGTEEYQTLQRTKRTMPYMFLAPNAMLMIGDMIVGEASRLAKDAAQEPGPNGDAQRQALGKPVAPAPRVPSAPRAPAGRSPGTPPKKPAAGVDATRFMEGGGDKESLEREAAALVREVWA